MTIFKCKGEVHEDVHINPGQVASIIWHPTNNYIAPGFEGVIVTFSGGHKEFLEGYTAAEVWGMLNE